MSTPPFVQSGQPLPEFLKSFWERQIATAEQETPDYRHPPLPLARIKKVMKSDPDVKMIAADAPILFCKACEIFIAEITGRAFIVADSNKRRTLSRADIAKALTKSDHFDFLIDIVPREEAAFSGQPPPQPPQPPSSSAIPTGSGTGGCGANGAGGAGAGVIVRKVGGPGGKHDMGPAPNDPGTMDMDGHHQHQPRHQGQERNQNHDHHNHNHNSTDGGEALDQLMANPNSNHHQRGPVS